MPATGIGAHKGAGVLLTLLLSLGSTDWDIDYDQMGEFTCPLGQVMSRLVSEHNNHYEDRRWKFYCSSIPNLPGVLADDDCDWDSYVNQYDQVMDFKCPDNGVVVGLKSWHNNHFEDRQYQFKCCKVTDYTTQDCARSGFVNDFDGEMDYTVTEGKPTDKAWVLTGMYSEHKNHYEDRRFMMETCQLVKQ